MPSEALPRPFKVPRQPHGLNYTAERTAVPLIKCCQASLCSPGVDCFSGVVYSAQSSLLLQEADGANLHVTTLQQTNNSVVAGRVFSGRAPPVCRGHIHSVQKKRICLSSEQLTVRIVWWRRSVTISREGVSVVRYVIYFRLSVSSLCLSQVHWRKMMFFVIG